MNEEQIKRITALGVKLMNIHVRMRRHHYGWLVTYPCEFVDWDFRTYREKYFESCRNGESGYRQAQRFVRETKEKIQEAQQRESDEYWEVQS